MRLSYLLIALTLAGGYFLTHSTSLNVEIDGQHAIVFSGGSERSSLNLGRARAIESRVFYVKREHSLLGGNFMHAAGIRVHLGVLSERDYDEFKQLEASGRCPASFLNERSTMFLVIPASAEIEAALGGVSTGDHIYFEGIEVTGISSKQGDESIPLQFSGAGPLLVTRVEEA